MLHLFDFILKQFLQFSRSNSILELICLNMEFIAHDVQHLAVIEIGFINFFDGVYLGVGIWAFAFEWFFVQFWVRGHSSSDYFRGDFLFHFFHECYKIEIVLF